VSTRAARYELYYWPGIAGRGEFVRLALEEAGARYIDVARRRPRGPAAVVRALQDPQLRRPAFAPPLLKAGKEFIGQSANILLYLGGRLGLAPRDPAGKLWVHQLQLTLADFVDEIHDTHHPIGSGLYYEQQRGVARRRARDFIRHRLPKYLGYFERVLERSPGPWLAGARLSYADLSAAHVIAGLRYAFPRATAQALRACPRLCALHEAVFARPRIRRYAASRRRPAFNQDGIFRHYPELDAPAR
jgi:glutathione S-transferase